MGNSQTFHFPCVPDTASGSAYSNLIQVAPRDAAHRDYPVKHDSIPCTDSPTAPCPPQPNIYRSHIKIATSIAAPLVQHARRKLNNVSRPKNKVSPICSTGKKAAHRKKHPMARCRQEKPVSHKRKVAFFSPKKQVVPRRKFYSQKKRVECSKHDYYVLRTAFDLLSRGKNTISVDDLGAFFSKYTNEKYSYEELRDMVHRACNGYEIDFDCFRRALFLSEQEHSSSMFPMEHSEPSSAAPLPGQCEETTTKVQRFHSQQDLKNSSKDWCDSNCARVFHLEESFELDRAAEESCECRSTQQAAGGLDRRSFLEIQKQQFGLYNLKCSRSFTSRDTSLSVNTQNLDLIVDHHSPAGPHARTLKRSVSQHATLAPVERDLVLLREVFDFFDSSKCGSIDAICLSRFMKDLGLKPKKADLRKLFTLVEKRTKADTIDFVNFVKLYRQCTR